MTRRRPPLADVIARHAPGLMARPGVIGVGEGRSAGKRCLLVFVTSPPSGLPDSIEGYPVVVERSGPFAAQRPVTT